MSRALWPSLLLVVLSVEAGCEKTKPAAPPRESLALKATAVPAAADVASHDACGGLETFELRREVADVSPGVLIGGEARVFDDARLHNLGIVGAASAGTRCVVFLDSAVEGPAWEVTVITSEDAGKSWQGGAQIRKPYYFALFEGAEFESATRGCVTVSLDDDYGSGVKVGQYRSCTNNAGVTWSPFVSTGSAPPTSPR